MGYLRSDEWSYYVKGTEVAAVKIKLDAILYKEKRNFYTDCQNYRDIKEINISGEVPIFSLPFDLLMTSLDDFENANFDKNKIEINNLLCYEKHYEICGIINDNQTMSIVWSQVNDAAGSLDIVTLNEEIICFLISNGLGTEYLVRGGYEYLTPLNEWFNASISQSGKGIVRYREYMVVMSDGVRLSTEVWLPSTYNGEEKYPVIFTRTPYGKKRNAKREAFYCDRGFAVVLQDVRGREDSEGDFIAMYHEKTDGSDALDWIASQPWCNGNIGMMGASYGGYVQWSAAASGNKNLKAIVSLVSSGSPFSDVERRGGGYNMGIIDWNVMMSEKKVKWDQGEVDWDIELKKRPIREIPQNITGKRLNFWELYMEHPDYDEFWREMTFSDFSDNIDIPALVVSGWHDGDLNGTVEIHKMNKKKKRENQRLVLGPWEHHFNTRRNVGEYKLGKNAIKYNMDLMYLMWLDKFLNGIQNNIEHTKVEFYTETLNQWIECESWPPEQSENTKFILRGSYNDDQYQGVLESEEFIGSHENQQVFRAFSYDPENPAPQLCDPKTHKPFTPINYSEVEKRNDVLSFTSDPFERDKIIVGQPLVKLYASSSAIDTDWVVRLTRVTVDGKSIRIADNLLRAKYRNGFDRPEYLKPDVVEVFNIELPYVGQLIKKGERIRLQVTSAQFGEMFPNTNTGLDPATDVNSVVAIQKVYLGQTHQSELVISMINMETNSKNVN